MDKWLHTNNSSTSISPGRWDSTVHLSLQGFHRTAVGIPSWCTLPNLPIRKYRKDYFIGIHPYAALTSILYFNFRLTFITIIKRQQKFKSPCNPLDVIQIVEIYSFLLIMYNNLIGPSWGYRFTALVHYITTIHVV